MSMNTKFERFIYTFLSITVLLDSINGFFDMYTTSAILTNLIPIVRLAFITMILIYIYSLEKKRYSIVLLLSLLFGIIIIVLNGWIYDYNSAEYFADFLYFSKIIFLIILIVFFVNFKIYNKNLFIIKILLNNAYQISLLIILPTILGIGRVTYEGSDLGNSGFFISNNATNIAMILLTIIVFFDMNFLKIRNKVSSFFYILLLVTLFLQGSKTSYVTLVFFLVMTVVVYLLINIKYSNLKISFLFSLLFLFSIMLISILFAFYNWESIRLTFLTVLDPFIQRQKSQINSQGNFLNYLNSGRFLLFNREYNYFQNIAYDLKYFTGIGYSNIMIRFGKISEMDFFDIYFIFGLYGIALTYLLTLIVWFKYKILNKKLKFFKSILVFVALVYSIVGGHVFVDILPITILGLILSIGNERDKV